MNESLRDWMAGLLEAHTNGDAVEQARLEGELPERRDEIAELLRDQLNDDEQEMLGQFDALYPVDDETDPLAELEEEGGGADLLAGDEPEEETETEVEENPEPEAEEPPVEEDPAPEVEDDEDEGGGADLLGLGGDTEVELEEHTEEEVTETEVEENPEPEAEEPPVEEDPAPELEEQPEVVEDEVVEPDGPATEPEMPPARVEPPADIPEEHLRWAGGGDTDPDPEPEPEPVVIPPVVRRPEPPVRPPFEERFPPFDPAPRLQQPDPDPIPERIVRPERPAPTPSRKDEEDGGLLSDPRNWAIAALLLLLLIVGIGWALSRGGDTKPTPAATEATDAPKPVTAEDMQKLLKPLTEANAEEVKVAEQEDKLLGKLETKHPGIFGKDKPTAEDLVGDSPCTEDPNRPDCLLTDEEMEEEIFGD